MNVDDRLKFMRGWVNDLSTYYPESHKNEIECLNWAIKQCQKNLNRNRDKKKSLYI